MFKIESEISRTCGETVKQQVGWIESVSYPNYYLGPDNCTITMEVDVGQRVQLTIVDLSIRGLQPLALILSHRTTIFRYRGDF